jgi:hypothetical protein
MHAYRSSPRLFFVGLVGLILIITALDVMFFHYLSTPPDGADAVLSTRGQAQQRGDMLWGASLIGMGVILFGASLIELVRRQPVVDVRDDGLYAQIGAQAPDVLIPWSAVDSVTSGITVDPFDGSIREQLVVTLRTPETIPSALAGAVLNGDELHIDAHDWNRPVTDVALAAQGARDHAMRQEIAAHPEPSPAMMWETRVDMPTEEIPAVDGNPDGQDLS